MTLNSKDPGRSSSAGASGTTRRAFIRAAGALGVATAAWRALPARAASGSRQFLGSTKDDFETIRSAVPGLSGVRMYGEGVTQDPATGIWTDHIRGTWPQPIPNGSTVPITNPGPLVYSIYPLPADIFNGSLHDTLVSLIKTAPPNSYLDTWHEALWLPYPTSFNSPGDGITSNNMYQVHCYMNGLVQDTNAKYGSTVTYGSIFGGGTLEALFDSVPPNLGFYGLDLYANDEQYETTEETSDDDSGITAAMSRLENFINLAGPKDTIHGYPKLMIPECNISAQVDRPEWFTTVCQRMHTYGSNAIGTLTFWRTGGRLSGPWVSTDTQTINAMNNIINNIF